MRLIEQEDSEADEHIDGPGRVRRWATRRRLTAGFGGAVVFAALLFAMLEIASHSYSRDHGFVREPSIAVSGDEPHYLAVINSLLREGDLELRQNYRRAERGGTDIGRRHAGTTIEHHSILVWRRTGVAARWSEVYDENRPLACERGRCNGYSTIVPGFDTSGQVSERSAHPIVWPLVAAAFLSIAGTTPQDIEDDVVVVQVFVAWLAVIFVYLVVRRLGGRRHHAYAAVGLLVASPWLAYSRSYFSEPLSGLCLITAYWAAQARRPVLCGLMLGALVWSRQSHLLIAVGFVLAAWLVGRRGDAVRTAIVVAVGTLAVVLFNYQQTGSLLLSGNQAWSWVERPSDTLATLVHLRYGLLVFTPWALVALAASIWVCLRARRAPSFELLSGALPILFTLGVLSVYGALGAVCYGPRYWVPFLPVMAVMTVRVAVHSTPRKWLVATLAGVSATWAIPGALCYNSTPWIWDAPPLAAIELLIGEAAPQPTVALPQHAHSDSER